MTTKISEMIEETTPNILDKIELSTTGVLTRSATIDNVGNTIFAAKDSDDLPEGATNKYFLEDLANKDLNNIKLADFNDWVTNTISSGTITPDWTTGAGQTTTLTENITTITQTDPISTTGWARLMYEFVQDPTGGRDITIPSNWNFGTAEPTWTDGTSNQKIYVTLVYVAKNDEYVAQASEWLS